MNYKLLDQKTYLPVLGKLNINESDYLDYMQHVYKVFPEKWSKQEFAKQKSKNLILNSLWPSLFPDLPHHPMPSILLGQYWSLTMHCEIIGLGYDLKCVSMLEHINNVKTRLTIFQEFLGAYFEIQVLAEFVRATIIPSISPLQKVGADFICKINKDRIWIEIKHLNPSDEMRMFARLGRIIDNFILYRHNFSGYLEIRLKETKIQDGEFLKALGKMGRMVKDKPIECLGSNFSIKIDPKNPKKEYKMIKSNDTYEELLYKRVLDKLNKKRKKQLSRNSNSIIALNARSVTTPYVAWKSEKIKKSASLWLRAIVSACEEFLKKTDRVQAILVWYNTEVSKGSSIYRTNHDRPILVGKNSSVYGQVRKILSFAVLPSEVKCLKK